MHNDDTHIPEDDADEAVSKTRRKQEMHSLQDLGEQLTGLPKAMLDKCKLPEELLRAIAEYKRIPEKRGARKRQLQYIGRVMRDIDAEPIRKVLEAEGQGVELEKRRFKRLEEIRERLLAGDQAMLDEVIGKCAQLDIQYLRQLIRQAGKEAEENKPPAASRKLFAYLREVME